MSCSIAVQVSAWGLFSFLISGHRQGRGPLESVFLGRRPGLRFGLRNFQSLSLRRCNMRNLVFNLKLGFVGDCNGISGGFRNGCMIFGCIFGIQNWVICLASWVVTIAFRPVHWVGVQRAGVRKGLVCFRCLGYYFGFGRLAISGVGRGFLIKFLPSHCEEVIMLYDYLRVLLELFRRN